MCKQQGLYTISQMEFRSHVQWDCETVGHWDSGTLGQWASGTVGLHAQGVT